MAKVLKGPNHSPLIEDPGLGEKCREWYDRLREQTLPLIREYHEYRAEVARIRGQLAEIASNAEALLAILGYGPQAAAAELATWKEEAIGNSREVGG